MKRSVILRPLFACGLLLLLLAGCAPAASDAADTPDTAVRSEGYEFDVLRSTEQYVNVLTGEAGVPSDLAEGIAAQHFASWDIDPSQPPETAAHQLARFVRYTHPDGQDDYGACFGFIAVMTTGETPVFEEVTYRYTAVPAQTAAYTLEPGASTAALTGAAVQIDADATVQLTDGGERYPVTWRETVDLSEMQPK